MARRFPSPSVTMMANRDPSGSDWLPSSSETSIENMSNHPFVVGGTSTIGTAGGDYHQTRRADHSASAASPPAAGAARSGLLPPAPRARRTFSERDDSYIALLDKIRRERGLDRQASIGDIVSAPLIRVSALDILLAMGFALVVGIAIGIGLHSGAVL